MRLRAAMIYSYPCRGARAVPLALVSLGIFSACSDDALVLPEVSWSSEDFDFATDREYPLCGGTLNFQQRFVDLAQDLFGEPVDGQKFTFYLFSPVTFNKWIGSEWIGLYDGDGRIFAKEIPNHHEVTHAVVDLAIGRSHTFFNEGIAEVFRDRYGSNRAPGAAGLEEGLEYDEKLPGSRYGRAGHFMSYALDVHGSDAVSVLLALARPGDPPDMLKADIAEAFGMPYEDVAADYADYPLCAHEISRWPITECAAGALIDEIDDGWFIDADLDCSREDMIGARYAENWTVNTIEVKSAGSYRVSVSVSGGDGDFAFVELGHCSPGCAPDKGLKIKNGEMQTVVLRQGRYHVSSVGAGVHLKTRIEAVTGDSQGKRAVRP